MPLVCEVSLEVKSHKTKLAQGEPLLLFVQISNTGDSVETIPWFGREFYSNKLNLGKILVGDEPVSHGMSPPSKPSHSTSPYALKPGEELTEKYIILFSERKNKYSLHDTKEHQIRLRYGSTYTDPIKVTIKNPTSEVDKTVWNKYLKNKKKRPYARLIHAPWQLNTKYSVKDKDRKLFHHLINKYPDSTYTPYITFSLARNYSARSVFAEENRAHLKKKAKKLFNKTLELTENKMITELTKAELKKLDKKERDKREFWVGK